MYQISSSVKIDAYDSHVLEDRLGGRMNKHGRWLGTLNEEFYKSKLNKSCFWHDLQSMAKFLQQLSKMRQA